MAQINKPGEHFNNKLYSGTGSSNSITGVGFQPDWVWVKRYDSGTNNHRMANAVTGASEVHSSNITNVGPDSSYFSSFDSDGFTVGTAADPNTSGGSYVSWNWKANGAGSANTDGSTNSTVSVNTTTKFSIVKWTGTGSGTTIGHGLGVKPKIIFVKNLDSARNWVVNIGEIVGTDERSLYLNASDAIKNDAAADHGYTYNNTTTTFNTAGGSGGTQNDVNESGSTMIAYCFADVKGFSKFGSYTGNGSTDGTFIYTGFKPAFVLIKRTSGADGWILYDTKRETFNVYNLSLEPNTTASNNDQSSYNTIDILSNGFKCRGGTSGSGTGTNQSGGSYIYMAFAEQPLVGTNNIPATAK
jgi:hypothetical protein